MFTSTFRFSVDKGSGGMTCYSDAFSSIKLHLHSEFTHTKNAKCEKILITKYQILNFFVARSSIEHFMNSVIFVSLHALIWSRLQVPLTLQNGMLNDFWIQMKMHIVTTLCTMYRVKRCDRKMKIRKRMHLFLYQMDSGGIYYTHEKKTPTECLYSVTSSGIR